MLTSIIQILRAANSDTPKFRTLQGVELITKESGEPITFVGNSALLLCAMIDGERHALKCYTSSSSRRKSIYGKKLLEAELYVPSLRDKELWVDVVVEPWIEGSTLKEHLEELLQQGDQAALKALSQRFDELALTMLDCEEAHGDLTSENIIVESGSGELRPIDFDARYLPQFASQQSEELGTEAFQHPSRTLNHFSRSADDYSIALISTALAVAALDASQYRQMEISEGMLFRPQEMVAGTSKNLETALTLLAHNGAAASYAIAQLLGSTQVELDDLQPLLRFKQEGIHPSTLPTTPFQRNGKWGFNNNFGREVIPPIFNAANPFKEQLAAVKTGEVWHYIDLQCRAVMLPFDPISLKSVNNATARARTTEGWIEIEIERCEVVNS